MNKLRVKTTEKEKERMRLQQQMLEAGFPYCYKVNGLAQHCITCIDRFIHQKIIK